MGAPRAIPEEEEPLSRIEATFQRLLLQGAPQRPVEVSPDMSQPLAAGERPRGRVAAGREAPSPEDRGARRLEEPRLEDRRLEDRRLEERYRIRQFGYAMFKIPASTFAPVEDVPVGPDYILGPGDNLTVYVWGAVESIFTETINRNGEIFIPKVGTLNIWGLSFEKAEQLIREHLSRAFTGFRTSVTLGRLRTIRVFVLGEVTRPGAYTLSALSLLTNALFAAGGPSKQGTLRRIRLLRNTHTVTEIDLYDFLLGGDKSRDARLESGDTVFVPTIGPVVGLVGNMNRPGIYELKGETLVTDVLTMAGGVSPSGYLQRLQLERFRANTDRVVQDFNLLDFYQRGLREGNPVLRDGDLLRVFPVDPRMYNTVALEGSVKRPGNYELRPGMRVGDLVTREEVLPEAYLERAEVVRVNEDLGTEVRSLSILDVWAGQAGANLELRPLDRVVIKSELRPIGYVEVTGEVKRHGRYAIARGERLSSLLERAGGFLPEAFPKGAVFTRESIRKIEQEELDKFLRAQEQGLIAESAGLTAAAVESGTGPQDLARAQTEILAQRRELLRSFASAVTLGRVSIRLDSPEKLKGTPSDILLEDGDALVVPQRPTSVLVLGSVRNSTAILHAESEDVEYYLAKAGGTTREADLDQGYILKPDGSAVPGYVKVRKVEAGDTIVVPASTEPRYRTIPLIKDIATIFSGFVLPLATILAISKL
jgi:polysaccharide export outer membrane protein